MSVAALVSFNSVFMRSALFSQCSRTLFPAILKANQSSKSSVDPSTVSHHGNLADKWWEDSGVMKALHSMNYLRVPLVREGLFSTGAADSNKRNSPRPLDGLKIVDVGCGGGLLSEPLARLGAVVTGIDASSELIDVARKHAELDPSLSSRLNYINTAAEAHATEASGTYDAVVSSEVIEHVLDKNFFLEQCIKLLKPKGSIFLTTLNRTNAAWLFAIVAAERLLNALPKGTHQWELFVKPLELQVLLENNNCSTKLIHGMCYNPITNEWKWSQNVNISYAMHAVKLE